MQALYILALMERNLPTNFHKSLYQTYHYYYLLLLLSLLLLLLLLHDLLSSLLNNYYDFCYKTHYYYLNDKKSFHFCVWICFYSCTLWKWASDWIILIIIIIIIVIVVVVVVITQRIFLKFFPSLEEFRRKIICFGSNVGTCQAPHTEI
jgi:hypothetical protein